MCSDLPQHQLADPFGPTLAALGAGIAVVLVGVVALLTRLLPAGHRRRWRPARTAVRRRA